MSRPTRKHQTLCAGKGFPTRRNCFAQQAIRMKKHHGTTALREADSGPYGIHIEFQFIHGRLINFPLLATSAGLVARELWTIARKGITSNCTFHTQQNIQITQQRSRFRVYPHSQQMEYILEHLSLRILQQLFPLLFRHVERILTPGIV